MDRLFTKLFGSKKDEVTLEKTA